MTPPQSAAATLPARMRGLFSPLEWSGGAAVEMVRVTGEAAQAQGTLTHRRGRPRAGDGTAIAASPSAPSGP
jgi:hypothetical protein